jgi:ribosome-associated protein
MTKTKKTPAFDLVTLCCRVLDEKKAEALTVLDVSAQSSITDYLILATATSEPHLRALRIELEKALDSTGSRIVGIEMAQESGWVVIDIFDVMVHLFLGAVREHYSLDRLWRDAAEVPLDEALNTPKPAKTTRPAAKRTKATKSAPPKKSAGARTKRKSS